MEKGGVKRGEGSGGMRRRVKRGSRGWVKMGVSGGGGQSQVRGVGRGGRDVYKGGEGEGGDNHYLPYSLMILFKRWFSMLF